MRTLGIETSCDECGIAIYDSRHGLLAHALHSQAELHAEFGGVVPELASRDHIRSTVPLLRAVLQEAKLSGKDIDGVAYTAGPGLAGALLVGSTIGRTLAWGWQVPAVAVHHMEGHLLAPMLEPDPPAFPFVALLVSGGHTLLVEVKGVGSYHLLGQSLDDAAGEAFDKTAKLLGLGYPGGPEIARLAQQGNTGRFRFPRPMTDRPGLDFSFSGLKTFARNTLLENDGNPQLRADIAAAFQDAVADTLAIKCERALRDTRVYNLVVAGGVSANSVLRQRLQHRLSAKGYQIHYPRLEFCTDNGAMIAFAGWQRLRHGQHEDTAIAVRPRWLLDSLSPPANGGPHNP